MKNYEGKTLNQSMFRNRPIWFIIVILLLVLGVENVINPLPIDPQAPSAGYGNLLIVISISWLFIWWLKSKNTRLCFTGESVSLNRGILSRSQNEVFYSDVRNIRISQSLFNRILGVGRIEISTAGQAGVEISVSGIPNPNDIKKFLNAKRTS